jgi:hypothetical protein
MPSKNGHGAGSAILYARASIDEQVQRQCLVAHRREAKRVVDYIERGKRRGVIGGRGVGDG